jgi:hypothetical protein
MISIVFAFGVSSLSPGGRFNFRKFKFVHLQREDSRTGPSDRQTESQPAFTSEASDDSSSGPSLRIPIFDPNPAAATSETPPTLHVYAEVKAIEEAQKAEQISWLQNRAGSTPAASVIRRPVNWRILSISPSSCVWNAEPDIAVAFSPVGAAFTMCRFGDVEVRGAVQSDGRLHCRAPRQEKGFVEFAISIDGVEWIRGVEFEFKGSQVLKNSAIALAIVGVALGGIIIFKRKKGMKPRKMADYTGSVSPHITPKYRKTGVNRRSNVSYL